MKMKLFFAPLSPFARKCRVVVIEKKLEGEVELVNAPPMDNPPELLAANPLATVPALLTNKGKIFCESPVICEYLDSLSPEPALIPAEPKQRFDTLALAALADGIMDAAVACVLESRRPEDRRYPEWVERKENAIKRTISVIAHRKFDMGMPLDIGIINVVVALGYVSFRLPHMDWRKDYPVLAQWYDAMSQRPSFALTAPK
jgi:glutathione S-transferase